MSAETPLSLSELVYLFVDGETTSAQEQVLFSHLASDADLQAELQEAILIRSTLEQDCSALAVPPETTAAIFSKAGFALPGTATGWSMGNVIGSTVQTLQSIALPSLFALGGAALTAFYFMHTMPQSQESELLALRGQLSAQSSESAVLVSNAESLGGIPSLDSDGASEQAQREYRSALYSSASVSNQSADGLYRTVQQDEAPFADATQSEEVIAESAAIIDESAIVIEQAPSVTMRTPLLFSSFPTTNPRPALSHSEFMNTDNSSARKWMVAARGLMTLNTMPAGNTSISDEHLSDFAVSVGYALNPQTVIGLEGGRQNIRYYTFENGKGENATLHTSMGWAGGYVRRQFHDFGFGELTPFAHVHIGGTLSGPSGRFITGLQWQPDSRISLSAGIEGSAFLYQNSGTWYSMRTLGLTYQVDVHL